MFDGFIAFHARARPRAPALITPTESLSYAELDAAVNRYAAGLRARGVGPASGIVSVDVALRRRHYALTLALARLGVASTASSDARADLRISDRTGDHGPGVLPLSEPWMAAVEAAAADDVESAPRDLESLARVALSSGTTQAPRRVPVSWRRLELGGYNALACYAADRTGVWIIRTGLDSSLGFSLAALGWSMGVAVALDFPVETTAALIEAHSNGLIVMTPAQVRGVLRSLPPGWPPRPGFRLIITGDRLPPSLAREIRLRLTPDVFIDFGSSETGRALVVRAQRLETTPGAVGWPAPGVTAEVVGPDGAPVADEEQGELRIRSQRNAPGYLDGPEASARTFRDGWVYPGDLARRLPDGCFVIDGRADERMNLGGVKLSPDRLENAAMAHPGVLDAAAFAIPGADGIDECWIAVAAEAGLDRQALASRLEAVEPRLPILRFAWTETIPQNAMGKTDRATLRAQTLRALGR